VVKGQRGVAGVVVRLNVAAAAGAVGAAVVVRRVELLGWRESGVGEDGRVVAGAAAVAVAAVGVDVGREASGSGRCGENSLWYFSIFNVVGLYSFWQQEMERVKR